MISSQIPFSITHKLGSQKLTIIYDTNFPFRFGTKIRKAESFYQEFSKKNYDGVQLIGDPNSNFLSAFTYFFYTKGVNVYSIHHSRTNFHGPNRILSERFSIRYVHENKYIHEYETEVHPQFKKYGNLLVIPRWGVSRISIHSMDLLWEYIKNRDDVDGLLYIDVGSGLTYLSCLHFFQHSRISIVGISIGLPKKKMIPYLESLENYLFGKTSRYTLEDVPGKFGKITGEDVLKLKKYRELGIYLEPIYSLRSVERILEIQEKKSGSSLYLHQGGLLTGISRGG